MSEDTNIRPLIAESSTSESSNVEVIMNDLRDGILRIPDYQRDSDQWSEETKSLLVESVINNLSIPAFFFEVIIEESGEKNEVIDGQQRLTTLFDFYQNRFQLVASDEAPYLSPNSIHYAGKTFSGLPLTYQQAFRRYRLTIIKLRQLGDMRLEVFRRINQGGTPLSGQDIRLAYYGARSASMALIRLAGIYDPERQAAQRFINSAAEQYSLGYPWVDNDALECWQEWWMEKAIAHGQTPSEMFLWSLVVSQVEELSSILSNSAALQKLNCKFNGAIDEALDAYCAQVRYQDTETSIPPALMPFEEMRDSFFPAFQRWMGLFLGEKMTSLQVTKHRIVAAVIGAAYRLHRMPESLSNQQWTNIVEFIRRPQEMAKQVGSEWPMSKGRWDGARGYKAQLKAAHAIVSNFLR